MRSLNRLARGVALAAVSSLFFWVYAFCVWLEPNIYHDSTFSFTDAFWITLLLICGFGAYGMFVVPFEMAADQVAAKSGKEPPILV